MSNTSVFSNYWQRKSLLSGAVPYFSVRRWWKTDQLCDIEQIYFQELIGKKSVLDIGAGDLRIKNKMLQAGFQGDYHTQDLSAEHNHTYKNLDEVHRTYDVVICLDVIEHISLNEGMNLLKKIDQILSPDGTLILQTPNARCIRNPLSWDMTHLHCYNLPDLWALFTSENYQVEGYRVVFEVDLGLKGKIYSLLGRFIITRLLGADYADNIALIARKGLKK